LSQEKRAEDRREDLVNHALQNNKRQFQAR
jgi:hypothetical protein